MRLIGEYGPLGPATGNGCARPRRSAAVITRSSPGALDGMRTPRIRARASWLRTNTTRARPGRSRSLT